MDILQKPYGNPQLISISSHINALLKLWPDLAQDIVVSLQTF